MEQMASHQTGINQSLEQGHQATHQSWSIGVTTVTGDTATDSGDQDRLSICQTDLQTPETRSSESWDA